MRNVVTLPRIALELNEQITVEQRRDLAVFVRDCVARIEHASGPADSWRITITNDRVCYSCELIAHVDGAVVRARGNGFSYVIAGGEAFRKLETVLLTATHGCD